MGQEYEIVKGFKTNQGLGRYDYDYLHNKPDLATQEQAGLLSPEDKARIDQIDKIKQAVDEIDYPVGSVNGKIGEVQLTKDDIGLNRAENKNSEEIRDEITSENVTGALGYVPLTPDEINGIIQGVNITIQTAQTTADKALQGAATALPIYGGRMTGAIDMNNNSLSGLAQPQKESDATTKSYVDDLVKNIDLSNYPTKEEVNNQFEEFQVDVDPTLSEPGQAADAQAVGEAINQIDKNFIGLGKVENKTSDEIREEITNENVTNALGYTPPTPKAVGDAIALAKSEAMEHAENQVNGLTAEDVGARPNTWMPTAEQVGAAPMEYAKKVGNPHNLLDNSDFRNPVNQRGAVDGDFAANAFLLDRWQAVDGSISCIYRSDRISFSNMDLTANAGICQRLAFSDSDIGKTYTLAVMTADGLLIAYGQLKNVTAWTWICQNENESVKIRLGRYANTDNRFRIDILAKGAYSANILWAALYEGEYTAETLPEYQPKGYAAELAECRRYYCRLTTADAGVYGVVLQGMITSGNKDIVLALPITTMRIARPTATISGGVVLRGISGYIENSDSGISVSLATLSNGVGYNIRVNKTDGTVFSVNAVNNTPVTLSLSAGSYMELSADL